MGGVLSFSNEYLQYVSVEKQVKWFGITNGQISSILGTVICPLHNIYHHNQIFD